MRLRFDFVQGACGHGHRPLPHGVWAPGLLPSSLISIVDEFLYYVMLCELLCLNGNFGLADGILVPDLGSLGTAFAKLCR